MKSLLYVFLYAVVPKSRSRTPSSFFKSAAAIASRLPSDTADVLVFEAEAGCASPS
jgi:hypothetical protein